MGLSNLLREFHIEELDMFGIQTQLNFLGKNEFKTRIGVVFSVLCITITTIAFFYFGLDMYYRDRPSTNISVMFDSSPEPFILDPT